MNNRTRLVSLVAAAALTATSVTAAVAQPSEYPREETLYTSGTQWGAPNDWNPVTDWNYAMGTFGLVYEPLFLFDPLKDEYVPWLAESGELVEDEGFDLAAWRRAMTSSALVHRASAGSFGRTTRARRGPSRPF